jgi:hypothetical protein
MAVESAPRRPALMVHVTIGVPLDDGATDTGQPSQSTGFEKTKD